MDLNLLLHKIKQHPDYEKAGMILCHNGIVRHTSRDGQEVTGLKVSVNHNQLERIIETYKSKPGIIEILVQINENKVLSVGDDVMLLLVAGDIRDNVIPVLNDTLNAIKNEATHKTEYFKDSS